MNKVKRRSLLSGTFLLLVLVVLAGAAAASPPLAVTLLDFSGEATSQGVHLEWETATELDTAAFRIKRATDANGPFEVLGDIGLIQATGDGSAYEATDETAAAGSIYWYTLVEVDFSNQEHDVRTIQVSLVPTATPEVIGGGGNSSTNTPVPASTDSPTSTNTPAPTTTSAANNTSPSTATPRPTNTRPPATATQPPATNTPAATPTRFVQTVTEQTLPSPTAQPQGVAEAAENSAAVAQVTETPSGYPAAQPESLDTGAAEQAPAVQETTPEVYPAGSESEETLDGNAIPGIGGRSVGEDTGATIGEETEDQALAAEQTQETAGRSRILLWLGFLFGMAVLIAGIVFSIVLSTRRRDTTL